MPRKRRLSSLCKEHSIQVVDMEKHFCNSEGFLILPYYKNDKIHLSRSGVRRLLDSVEKTCKPISLEDNYKHCAFKRASAADKQNTRGQSSQNGCKSQDQRSDWQMQSQRNRHRNQRGNQSRNQPPGQKQELKLYQITQRSIANTKNK